MGAIFLNEISRVTHCIERARLTTDVAPFLPLFRQNVLNHNETAIQLSYKLVAFSPETRASFFRRNNGLPYLTAHYISTADVEKVEFLASLPYSNPRL